MRHLIALVLGGFAALTLAGSALATDPFPGGDPGGIHTITKDKVKIERLLKSSGWVSPHLKGKPLWMISFRSCPDCIRFEKEQFDDLHKAGVDTRVIMVARRTKSTPAERTGVGELWAKRDWKTYEDWTAIPVDAFTGEGMKSGDDDKARAALVERGRKLIDDLTPLLAENGLPMHYPTLIWADKTGRLRGCACEERETYSFFRKDLGVKETAPTKVAGL
ncbi:MAG: hypothetical protein M3N05_09580 [Pseudomonadota bacterium]|nr:hypothetical protein [Pseudomonadota bacterium]